LTTSTPSCLASSDARRLGAAGPGTLAPDAVMTTTLRDSPVTLVTGANKRIGLETVRRLVDAGYRVYLGARDAERGRAAAEAAGAEFVQLDVTSDDSVRRAADILERAEGHLDVLVRSASVPGCVKRIDTSRGFIGHKAVRALAWP
jgi:NAD(P)-dependent dehydrogenase (short-subunit alcohol dehydrogenase family)